MLLHEKKVFVGTFVPRKEREKEMGEKVNQEFGFIILLPIQ